MNEIQQWLANPDRNYEAGVAIFATYSKNKMLVRYFQTGSAKFRMGKLVYEMGKLAKSAPALRASVPAPDFSTAHAARVVTVKERHSDLPDFILAAKKEVAALYALIDKKHQEIYNLGCSNEDDVIGKRKRMLDKRKPIIERADRLYRLKEDWFALEPGVEQERVAAKIRELLASPLKEQPTITKPSKSSKPEQTLPEVSALSDLQLTKRRTQLRSSITKTQNMLQYQSIKKAETPTPMPDGPKRTEYEERLKALKAELTAVTAELERRGA